MITMPEPPAPEVEHPAVTQPPAPPPPPVLAVPATPVQIFPAPPPPDPPAFASPSEAPQPPTHGFPRLVLSHP